MIASELKDPRIGFVTVTRVELTADLRIARVNVGVLGEPGRAREDASAALQQARGLHAARARAARCACATRPSSTSSTTRASTPPTASRAAGRGAHAAPQRRARTTTSDGGRASRRVAGVDGVLVVDKPAGPTSHDVVDRVRRALRRAPRRATPAPSIPSPPACCPSASARRRGWRASWPRARRRTARRVRLGFATTTDDLTGEPLGAPRPVAVVARGAGARPARALVGTLDAGAAGVLRQAGRRPAALRAGAPGRGRGARGDAGHGPRARRSSAATATRSSSRCAARRAPTCARWRATWASAWAGAHLTALRRTRSRRLRPRREAVPGTTC